MSHELFRDSRLFALLPKLDSDMADETRAGRCLRCGGALHAADYPRKPRGGPREALKAEYTSRHSFCCAEDDCRKRATPPSVRFLGRRVYVGAVVVLVAAMLGGITEKRVAELRERVSPTLSARTLGRWRDWWREAFATSPFWRAARARFARPVEAGTLPVSLLARFRGEERDRLVACLRFLAPITTSPGLSRVG